MFSTIAIVVLFIVMFCFHDSEDEARGLLKMFRWLFKVALWGGLAVGVLYVGAAGISLWINSRPTSYVSQNFPAPVAEQAPKEPILLMKDSNGRIHHVWLRDLEPALRKGWVVVQ